MNTPRPSCVLAILLGIFWIPQILTAQSPLPLGEDTKGESAWDLLAPSTHLQWTHIERNILQVLTPDQAESFLAGDDPASIQLGGGMNLDDLIGRLQREAASGLNYFAVAPCSIVDAQQASFEAGQSHLLKVRGRGADEGSLGDAADGCGIPGARKGHLEPMAARALLLKVEIPMPVGDGVLWLGPARSGDSSALQKLGIQSREPLSTVTVVPLCDDLGEGACAAGDLEVGLQGNPQDLQLTVLGYFDTPQATGSWVQNGDDLYFDKGNVAIGTDVPGSTLHVKTDDAKLFVENDSTVTSLRSLLTLRNNGRTQFTMENSLNGAIWSFDASTHGDRFFISKGGTGAAELIVGEDGTLTAHGALTSAGELTLDGNNSLITAQSGSIGFADENLTTTGTVEAGGIRLSNGATAGHVLTSDGSGNGTWQAAAGGSDDLGNHTASEHLKMNGFWISNDGDPEGLLVEPDGDVAVGKASATSRLDSAGDINTDGVYRQDGRVVLDTLGSSVFIGPEAGGAPGSSGNENVFIGDGNFRSDNTGGQNVFIGDDAGGNNSTGSENVFIGEDAGDSNTTGEENVFIGADSGDKNLDGEKNVFIGKNSGLANTSGSLNVFLGSEAGFDNIDGEENVFLGDRAGFANQTGLANVAIGSGAGANNSSGSRNIFIGRFSGPTSSVDDQLFIDNKQTPDPLIHGNFATDRLTINGDLTIDGSCSNCSSDLRLKQRIEPLTDGLSKLLALAAVSFEWTESEQEHQPRAGRQLGVIAQEVEQQFPELVGVDRRGFRYVRYQKLVVPLIAAVQAQQAQIEQLRDVICQEKPTADICPRP